MELNEAIAKFKGDIEAVKAEGKSIIEIDRLEKYLDGLLTDASLSMEYRRLAHQSQLEEYRASAASSAENFRAVIGAGKDAINAAIVVNGGAVISLLAFIGNLVSKAQHNLVSLLALPLLLFGIGVLCGAGAFGFRYISQFFYSAPANPKSVIAGHIFNGASWTTTASAMVLFGYGIWVCFTSLRGL